jgi:RNA polymerase sigma-70 factor (ECF subfamily)
MSANALEMEADLVSQLPHLRAFALRLCGRPDEADDLVQEAAERALRWARAVPGRNALRPWLRRVVHNLFIDGWRRRVREALEPGGDPDALPAHAAEPEPRWTEIDPGALQAAVTALAPDFRAVYRLHAEGRDYHAIARSLGLPINTVGTRLHRARKKLRALLDLPQPRRAA